MHQNEIEKSVVRSPNYPRCSLEISVERLKNWTMVSDIKRINEDEFIRLIGHKSLSGTCYPRISSMLRFGLIEKFIENNQVFYSLTERALVILQNNDSAKRMLALQEAFYNIKLFRQIKQKFEKTGNISDVETFLTDLGFRPDYISLIIAIYESSRRFAELNHNDRRNTALQNESIESHSFIGMKLDPSVKVSGDLTVNIKEGLNLSFTFNDRILSEIIDEINKCVTVVNN